MIDVRSSKAVLFSIRNSRSWLLVQIFLYVLLLSYHCRFQKAFLMMDESSADWEKSCGFKRSGACQIHSWSSFFSFTLDISPMPTLPTLHLLVHTPSSRLQHIAIQWVVNVTMEASGSGKLANSFGRSSMLSPSSWHLDTQYTFTYCSLQETKKTRMFMGQK